MEKIENSAYPIEFDEWSDDIYNWTLPEAEGDLNPKTRVVDEITRYRLDMEIPGVQKENVSVEVNGQVLKVVALKHKIPRVDSSSIKLNEIGHGDYKRLIMLNADADTDCISAKLVNGILTITIKKQDAKHPKKIHID